MHAHIQSHINIFRYSHICTKYTHIHIFTFTHINTHVNNKNMHEYTIKTRNTHTNIPKCMYTCLKTYTYVRRYT